MIEVRGMEGVGALDMVRGSEGSGYLGPFYLQSV